MTNNDGTGKPRLTRGGARAHSTSMAIRRDQGPGARTGSQESRRGRPRRHRWAGAAMIATGLGLLLAAVPSGGPWAADPPFEDPVALLRAALAARDDDRPAEAEWLLTEMSIRHEIVADHADLLRTRLLLETDQPGQAVAALLEALKRHRDSPLRSDFYQLLGDARSEFGDTEAARSAWRSAVESTQDGERKATLWRKVAESFEADDKPAEAGEVWLRLWSEYPTRSGAMNATERLARLEKRLEKPLRTGSSWRRRGDRLFLRRHNESALAAFDRAIEMGLSDSELRRAQTQRAHTLFRLRRYDEAVKAFALLPQEDSVRLWHARSLARSGDVPSSVEHFEQLSADRRNEIGMRARFLAALLLEGKGHEDRARKYFESVARADRYRGLAVAARWRLGWAAYRNGQWGKAAGYFDALAKDSGSDPIGALRPRYWRARALGQQGAPSGREQLETLAREYPFSYYGWRARVRLGEAPDAEGGTPGDGTTKLSGADLARPQILMRAGLSEAAIEELRRVERKARGLSDRLSLADLYTEGGEYHRAQRVIVDAYQEPLARGPLPGSETAWWYAWPTAYAELVDRATSEPDSVEPQLVYSIMREESGYRPRVLSVSGARGLLQIMEPTGRRLAEAVGRPGFAAADLFEPRVNIQLGAHYLGELSQRFPERLSAAIASYNAGPSAVSRWVREDGHRSDDEWVESIPYEQTRAYVKRVLRSLYAYRELY